MSSTWGLCPLTPTPSAGPDFSDAKSSQGPTEVPLKPSIPSEYPRQDVKPSSPPQAGVKPPQAVLERGSSPSRTPQALLQARQGLLKKT